MVRQLLLLLFFLFCGYCVSAKITLPALFTNDMVLQRDAQVQLWGHADSREEVTIVTSWNQQTYTAKADAQGAWSTKVSTPSAGGPYMLSYSTQSDQVVLEGVMSGEVWICSGQSNMHMPMKGYAGEPVDNGQQEILAGAAQTQMRLFSVKPNHTPTAHGDIEGEWSCTSIESVANFSATAYYFGKYLIQGLNVPVGLIVTANPGTRIEAWMSIQSAQRINPDILSTDTAHRASNKTGILFQTMLTPLAPFTARGFIWYQGESNVKQYLQYSAFMQAMVGDWRQKWGNDQMPFYFVQLAPYYYNNRNDGITLPLQVEQQIAAANAIPYSGIAATLDIGAAMDIHPPQKEQVGFRLALLALSQTYGIEGLVGKNPMVKEVEFMDWAAVVSFETATHMSTRVKQISGFELAGEDKVFYPAEAMVLPDKKSVRVYSAKVPAPVALRYAFRNVIEADLYNSQMLPLLPYRTDQWDEVE